MAHKQWTLLKCYSHHHVPFLQFSDGVGIFGYECGRPYLDVGFAVLPYLLEKFRASDTDFQKNLIFIFTKYRSDVLF